MVGPTPQEFVSRWRGVTLKERSASQPHFIDLCRLVDQPTPTEADPTGDFYTFERGAEKTAGPTGGDHGWADVWKKGHFAWEYKGPRANLDAAYEQLLQYRESLENPPLLVVSDLQTIEVHTNFTNSVKRITTFALDDLLDPDKLDQLRRIWTDPFSFRAAETPENVTEQAAREFARLAEILRQRGEDPDRAAHFLIRLLFCLFAEDVRFAKLDPNKLYGIWWYNRRNVTKSYDSETDGDNGKRYVTRTSVRTRDDKDWIAVPVPAYLPRKLVDQARLMIESRSGLERKHRAREWELKGVLRCSCGQNMITNTSRNKNGNYHYYRCKREAAYGRDACPQRTIRIERVEPLIREFVFGVLSDPDTIRRGLDALIQRETEEVREDSKLLAQTLSEKLSQNARARRSYQDQQAAGLMTLEELAARLEELEHTRRVLEDELASLERTRQKAKELNEDREAALASLAASIPEALDGLTGEEINTVYRKLRLRVVPSEAGYDATGVICTLGPTPGGRTGRRGRRHVRAVQRGPS